MLVDGRGEMSDMVVGGLGSCLGEVVDGGFGVDGVPGDDGVGEEGDAFTLEVLVFTAALSQFPLVSENELPAEGVEGFRLCSAGYGYVGGVLCRGGIGAGRWF